MSLGESIVTVHEVASVELTMIEIDVSLVESKMLGCFFTALYHLYSSSFPRWALHVVENPEMLRKRLSLEVHTF